MSRIKNTNTNTNINRININVPRQYRPRQPKKKSVAEVEQALAQDENQDRAFTQAPQNVSINPNIYGFNTSPLNREVVEPVRPTAISRGTQTEPMETQTDSLVSEDDFLALPRSPRMAVAEPISTSEFRAQRGDSPREPIPFRSSSTPIQRDVLALGYSEPQYKLNIPSDFSSRLARQEGFQPSSSSFAPFYANRMRDINKQGRPDINEMARNVKEAYRNEQQITPFVKKAETPIDFGVSPIAFEDMPLEQALPPAQKKARGRPPNSKNKPKPKAIETQTGASLLANEPQEVLSAGTQFTQAKKVKKPKGALRGQIAIEDLD
jgi:hypothetical protein